MPHVVLLRAANVGGHNTMKPSELARALSALDVVSIGAAGTFVVRKRATEAAVRRAFTNKLTVAADAMVCSADDIAAIVRARPFGEGTPNKDAKWFVTVLASAPALVPRLPVQQPAGASWQVSVFDVRGRYVLSRWRRSQGRLIYPSQVVEKLFATRSTTRDWNTLERIVAALT